LSAFGIMGEDETDVLTLEVILRRLIPRDVAIKGRHPPKGRAGCAALRKAAKTYMKDLEASGCTAMILLHDLDLNSANNELNDEARLRARLATIPVPSGIGRGGRIANTATRPRRTTHSPRFSTLSCAPGAARRSPSCGRSSRRRCDG